MSETISMGRTVGTWLADDGVDLVAESKARLISYFERLSASPEVSRQVLEHILSSSSTSLTISGGGHRLSADQDTSTFGRRIDSVLATIDGGLLSAAGDQDAIDLFAQSAPLTVPVDWVEALATYSTVEDPGFEMPDVTATYED